MTTVVRSGTAAGRVRDIKRDARGIFGVLSRHHAESGCYQTPMRASRGLDLGLGGVPFMARWPPQRGPYRTYPEFYPESERRVLLVHIRSRPVINTALRALLGSDGVDVTGTARGLNGSAVQATVLVTEALYRRAYYLAERLATSAHLVNQRFRANVGRAALKKFSYPSSNVSPTRPLVSAEFIARRRSLMQTPRNLRRLRKSICSSNRSGEVHKAALLPSARLTEWYINT